MKPAKGSSDNAEQRTASCPCPEESLTSDRSKWMVEVSGSSVEDAPESTYLERKALSAAGQWGRVTEMPSGCWEWQGAKNDQGYGGLSVWRKYHPAHRLILEIFDGPLRKGEMACHSCNNTSCCNPKHLTRGVALDNSHDYVELRKGRPLIMSPDRVEEAKALYASGKWTLAALGARYGVCGVTIRNRIKDAKRLPAIETNPLTAEARRLYAAGGWSLTTLGAHLGVKWWSVARMVRGIKRPDFGRARDVR